MLSSKISSQISHQQLEQIKVRPFNLRTEHRDSQVLVWSDQFIPKYSLVLIRLNWGFGGLYSPSKIKTKLGILRPLSKNRFKQRVKVANSID